MNKIHLMMSLTKLRLMILSCCLYSTCGSTTQINFDVLLHKTDYACLLKELICLTDTIALMQHTNIDKDEKRFIEDSILGKVVRSLDLLQKIDPATIPPEDVTYLFYWINLAKTDYLSIFIRDHIDKLERTLHEYFN